MSDGGERKDDVAWRAGAPRSPFVAPRPVPRVHWLPPRPGHERPPVEAPDRAAAPDPSPERPAAGRGLRALLGMVAVAAVAFVAGLWAFNAVVMPRLVHGPGEVLVPDLANLTVEQAERALAPTGLQLSRAGERFDPGVPNGFILSQDPAQGTPVRGQRRVMVVVSMGEENSSVPDLAGVSRRTADVELARAGLVAGNVTRAPSDDVAEGMVMATDPPADALLSRGTSVALLISSGATDDGWVMPTLVGRDLAVVRRELEALGLRVRVREGAPAAASVVSQRPAPGERLTKDQEIELEGGPRTSR